MKDLNKQLLPAGLKFSIFGYTSSGDSVPAIISNSISKQIGENRGTNRW